MAEKPHILVISQYFYPEPFRINDMAVEWVKRGYEVTVLTGIPNYPMGKFYPGYSWIKRRREFWNGMEIIRIPLIARGHTPIGLVLNYFSFVIFGWLWNRFTKINADLVFSFEVSPMTQVKVGCGYAKKHHVPHFAYIQDLWPENVEVITGIRNKAVINSIDKMVDKIYKQVDQIFVTSVSFAKAVANRKVRVPKEKIHYWPQYAEEFYQPMTKVDIPGIPDDGSFKIAFTGAIGYAQGLDILPRTALLLRNENVKFVIVGDGRYQAEFEKEIRKQGVGDKFILLPRQAAERIPRILSACDAGFISFMDTELFEKTIPAKLQSYMACGMPILAAAKGETQRIVREAGCGYCCEIGNEAALAEAVKTMTRTDCNQLRKNSRKYFEEHFDKKRLMDLMDKWFEER